MEGLNQVTLALGSNLGDKEAYLEKAIVLLASKVGNITKRSSFYYSNPVGFISENRFCNMCLRIETPLTPHELLGAVKAIEKQMGRNISTKGYTDRIIDIDIIFYNNDQLSEPELIIPHPHWEKRDFVYIPLRELG
jgi:2-amino-4-hydroxy-6-hydroxymethyldihydropteridine diphosphokinase